MKLGRGKQESNWKRANDYLCISVYIGTPPLSSAGRELAVPVDLPAGLDEEGDWQIGQDIVALRVKFFPCAALVIVAAANLHNTTLKLFLRILA